MKVDTKQNLERLIALIDRKVAEKDRELGPRPDWMRGNYEALNDFRRREHAAEQAIIQELSAEEGAVISISPPDGHSMRLAGVRTTCTSGWGGLFANWQAAAVRRILKDAGNG